MVLFLDERDCISLPCSFHHCNQYSISLQLFITNEYQPFTYKISITLNDAMGIQCLCAKLWYAVGLLWYAFGMLLVHFGTLVIPFGTLVVHCWYAVRNVR